MFDLSRLDFENEDRQRCKETVLKVLRKVVDLSNSNLPKNADGLLSTKPHKNEDILWVGESSKHIPENLFAFLLSRIRTCNLRLNDFVEILCVFANNFKKPILC